ncbi:DUF21 domain-containing protein At1g55930, chloroplastic-like isoform X2 [Zingiber officinale]|uniref:DUF21 domain-containing protein At1g55930, chloroplastic-like isoform X2 n=1 Tax=Zingiber officinale TaxID=94328 RepID=UPI001C4D3DED|nr:DUF21 domain-containing protein At1g55930, chloroplastic-like isoform X2 [Zingiber officinale]
MPCLRPIPLRPSPNPSANSPSLHSRPPMLSAAFRTSLFARPTPRGRLDNRTPISCLPLRIYPPPIRSCNGRRSFLASISRSLCCSTGSRVARSPVGSGLDSDTRAMPSSDQRVPVLELVRSRGFRSLLAMIACGLLAANCGRVLAAEGVAESGILAFGSKKAVFSGSWPKLLQVLGVLREQGLFLAALLGISAFFSMAETSITTLWPWKVRELAEKDPENGVFRMLQSDVTRFLTTILIGTTVVNIGATALVTDAATAIFGEAGISAATGVMTVAILLLTEITPKSIAVHNAAEVARFVVRPVAWLSVVLYPVGRITTFLSMGMLKMLGLKGRSEPYVTEDELKLMLRGAELSGAIEEEEQDMIENVLEIKDTHVKEVMTPLVDVIAIDASAKLADFKNLWETYQYSRVPVFQDRIDNIVGIAYAMDMLEYVEKADHLKDSTVREIAHMPTYFIPDSMSVWNLLRELRIRKVHMAVVLNEYGGTVGIVTLEDVVEEIVGEIFDENDSKGHQYETVSGFICEVFGYIPEEGGKIAMVLEKAIAEENSGYKNAESDGSSENEKHQKYEIEIVEANARKVGKVRFKAVSSKSSDLETKGINRLVSKKVVKRKKQIDQLEKMKEDSPLQFTTS